MTRQTPRILSLSLVLLFAACGPDPIRPRPAAEPPADPITPTATPTPAPVSDAGAPSVPTGTLTPDAGDPVTVDAGAKRQQVSPRDDRDLVPVADAGDDATGADAGVETVAARPPTAGEVVVTEVLANPSGADTGREWIEIANRAPEALDLSALHVADAAIDVAAPAGIIDPGRRLVLGQVADVVKNGGAPVAVAYGARLALNNDGEQISICIGPCADGLVIDRVEWTALDAAYDGHAIVFDRDAGGICPATRPFGTGGNFGTPGDADDACVAPDAGF